LATGAFKAASFIFELSKEASEFGSAIYDASQKTGLSAVTLSSLQVAAEQAGSSLSAVEGGLAKFAKTIGEANDGSDQAQAKLAKIGVTSTNLDEALGQALATIAKYPPGVEQMTAAQAAFGKSGADLIPMIRSFDGDLPSLIEKCKKLGLTLSDEAAAAADDFGDTLDTLNAQAAMVGRQFALQLMPSITTAMKNISQFMSDNKEAASAWGKALLAHVSTVSHGFATFGSTAKLALDITTAGFTRNTSEAQIWSAASQGAIALFVQSLGGAIVQIGRLKDAWDTWRGNNPTGQLPGETSPATPTAPLAPAYKGIFSPEEQKKRADFDYDQNQKQIEDAKKAAEQAAEDRKKARERDFAAQQENIQKLIRQRDEWFDSDQKGFEEAFIKREITEDQWRETSERNYELYSAEVKKLLLNAFKLDAQGKTPLEIANLRLTEQTGFRAVDAAVARERENREKAFADLKKQNNAEEERARRESDAKEEEAYQLRRKWALEVAEAWHNALIAEQAYKEELMANLPSTLTAPTLGGTDAVTTGGPFEAWKTSWEEFIDSVNNGIPTLESNMGAVAGILQNAFSGLASAIGSVVQNYILMGSTGPAVARKLLASVLASIAAESAVRAIFELAKGFAAMFLNPPEAAAHFQSAALFGSIAVGAGIAGRAVAGDAFAAQTGGGGARNSQGDGAPQSGNLSSGGAVNLGGNNRGPVFGELRETLNRLTMVTVAAEETHNRLANRISSVSPGVLVAQGAAEDPRAITNAVKTDLDNGGSFAADSLMRGLGFAT
jgi:hypothetical protein